MEILFLSDYVCPYCLVTKEALSRALEASGIPAEVHYLPYELTPEPQPRVDTYHDEHRRAKYQILVEPCRQLGLDMKLPPNVVPRPYTRLAFEGWHYACDHGKGDVYNDLVYRAYFIDEQDIGQIPVLAALAARAGLDAADFTRALEQGVYTARQQEALRYAREELKPVGVPSVFVDGVQVHFSEFTRAEMLRILNDHAFPTGSGSFCGPDGC